MELACYGASALALIVIFITMIARANDLRWRRGIVWNVRLIGFTLVGFSTIGIAGWELMTRDCPSIYEVCFRIGLMFVFLTTPNSVPWWRWVGTDEGSAPP